MVIGAALRSQLGLRGVGQVAQEPRVADDTGSISEERDGLSGHELRAEDGLLLLLLRDGLQLEGIRAVVLGNEQFPRHVQVEELHRAAPLALGLEPRAVHVDRRAGQELRNQKVDLTDLFVQLAPGCVADVLARTGEPASDVEHLVELVDERPVLQDAADVELALGVAGPHDGRRAAAADTPGLGVAEGFGAHRRLAVERRDLALLVEKHEARHVDLDELAVAEIGEDSPLVVDVRRDGPRGLDSKVGHGILSV